MVFGMNDIEYWTLMFGTISFGILGIAYYHLFKNANKYIGEILGEKELRKNRYY